MKSLIGSLLFLLINQVVTAQFYYKDVVVNRQTTERWKHFKDNKVKTVRLSSFEGDGQPSEGFECSQEITDGYSLITTHTKSNRNPESTLMAWYSPEGLPTKTLDTSDTYQSTSEYRYDAAGRLSSITNTSVETDNQVTAVEQHLWQYDAAGKPSLMYKIKNGTDTTYVRFVTDDKGNIVEEHATRHGEQLPTVYYYYDDDHRLTDIVRFSPLAQKLLPDYIFDYNTDGTIASMLMVPEQGSNEYQKWVYQYNDRGLETKESCFNKRRELMGSIDYAYR